VRRVDDAATAAALKLVAYCGLADAVLALRDSLRQARHGADTFTDVFLLVHADGHWRIANKAYRREPRHSG
jgi:hypothetical protein